MTEKRVKLKKINNESVVGTGNISVLTSQDISGKEDKTNKSSSISTDTGSTTKYPTVKAVEDYAQQKGNYLTSHQDISGKLDIAQTLYKGKNVVVDSTTGNITFESKPTVPSASSSTPSADTSSGAVGTGTTWARADHKHPKSSIYAEATHNHTKSQITDFPTIPTDVADLTDNSTILFTGSFNDLTDLPNLLTENDVSDVALTGNASDLNNDVGFITTHQSLNGYLQTSDVKNNLTSTDIDKPLSALQGKELKALIDAKENTSNKVTSISSSSTDTQYPSAKLVYDETSEIWGYVENLDYEDIGGNYTNVDEGIQAQGLSQIISQIVSRLINKSNTDHTHSGYASSSHTHGTWSSTSITNGTLYYNTAIRMCALRYSRTFTSATANTLYEWGQLIPSTYRPLYMVTGNGNRNGATITIDSDGYVYGRFAIAFSSSTSFYYHIMWHY